MSFLVYLSICDIVTNRQNPQTVIPDRLGKDSLKNFVHLEQGPPLQKVEKNTFFI